MCTTLVGAITGTHQNRTHKIAHKQRSQAEIVGEHLPLINE